MATDDWMLVYASKDVSTVLRTYPEIDREATSALVERLYPSHDIHPIPDGTLLNSAAPPPGEIYAAVFPGIVIVCTQDAALDTPTRLAPRFLSEAAGRNLYLHKHGPADSFAFAIWSPDGTLRRSFSFSWAGGWREDIGTPLPFEQLRYPEDLDEDDYPLDPLVPSDAALQGLFGFNHERSVEADDPDPEEIVLAGCAVMPR